MPKLLFATLVALFLFVSTAPVAAGDKNEGAERQQAVEHSREVHRMKERTREQQWQLRNRAAEDREKVKEHADEDKEKDRDDEVIEEQEEGFGNDLDEK